MQVCEDLHRNGFICKFCIEFCTIVVGRTYSVLTGLPPKVIMMSDVTSDMMVDTLVRVMVV